MKVREKVRIIGDITWEAFEDFSIDFNYAEQHTKGDEYIEIELASDGGDAAAALAFSSRIRTSKKRVMITAYGNVMSAATLILVTPAFRRMTKESWVMVHEDSVELSGEVAAIERESTRYRQLENQWNALMAQYTIVTASNWEIMNKKTTYIDADTCLKYGMIDEVI